VDIQVINIDVDDDRHVLVQVFDWSNNAPVAVPVASVNGPNFTFGGGGPIEIEESTAAAFFTTTFFAPSRYEVRVTFFNTSEDVVVTSQGIDFFGNNVVGQTVLDRSFKTVEVD
jgi:hypothetical protein